MPYKPRSKRLKVVKRGRKKKQNVAGKEALTPGIASSEHETETREEDSTTTYTDQNIATHDSSWQDINFHDYAKPYSGEVLSEVLIPPQPQIEAPDLSVLKILKEKVDIFLFPNWVSVLEKDGISIVLMSRGRPRASQRSIFVDYTGDVEIAVHNHCIDSTQFLKDAPLPVPLSYELLDEFVDRAACIVSKVRVMEVCAGVDAERYESVWESCKAGYVDANSCGETRYVQSYRSFKCKRLVNARSWRCEECTKLLRPLRRKLLFSKQEPKPTTPNIHLTEDQMRQKLKNQRSALDSAQKKIKMLHNKARALVKNEGVRIDNQLCDDFTKLLKSQDLAPAQEIFLHQQVKASNLKNKNSMRWHPTMIRFALSLHLASPAAYDDLRDTGMIKLPCRRTLFDYTHVKPLTEGLDKFAIESVMKRVKLLKKGYQRYHVLIADEMYISKNLVFQKSTGKMIGFTKLDEADKEVNALNAFLDNPNKEVTKEEVIASKVLCFMVKGTANNIKEVVASYAVANPTANQMYLWTWHVISALECGGIRVISFICDGSSTNRKFINLHIPATKLASGVVMDTVNKAAPHRILYFMSDVAHLVKTIRNCFCKSRADPSKGKRCMKRRGQKIVWDFIIRLFKDTRGKTLRKCFKLSPMHVYPDSYSCMKVLYAAQVLSFSVATELLKRKYPGVEETAKFIIAVNNWFDQLNGAHSSVGRKKNNKNLSPYTSADDIRFKELENFLADLDAWKAEAYSKGADASLNSTVTSSIVNDSLISDADVTFHPVENIDDDDWEDDDGPAGKRILSHQTLKGIEMTTRAFINCVKFLLQQGTVFINARVFSQDPLEQHFSKQRMGGGGSTNPNLQKFLWKNRALHIRGQLGMKRSRGNTTEVEECHVIVTEERLEKRKRARSSCPENTLE